jgi:hypothetical protein
MHPQILARRQLDAQNRIIAAAATLAEKFNVEPPAVVSQRLPDVAHMLRWEAVAAFLEALASAQTETAGVDLNEILAIPGLSKTAIKAIEDHFTKEQEPDEIAQN